MIHVYPLVAQKICLIDENDYLNCKSKLQLDSLKRLKIKIALCQI